MSNQYSRRNIEYIVTEDGYHICTSHAYPKAKWSEYLMVSIDGNKYVYNRYNWEQKYGKIPDGMCLRHKCDNSKCINIEHLELGTHTDNMRDIWNRDRCTHVGEKNSNAKLTSDQVCEIRRLLAESNLSQEKIGEMFGVTQVLISAIKLNKLWKEQK